MQHDQMARPYAFDRVFVLPRPDREIDPRDAQRQCAALRAELDQRAKDHAAELGRARADGFASGLAQARTETAAALLAATTMLGTNFGELEARFIETERRMGVAASEVAVAAAGLLAAGALAANPIGPLDAAIGRVLAQTGFREALHVHVHPALVEQVESLLDRRRSDEQRPLAALVHGDPDLAPGDAHILWDRGGLSLDYAAREAAVRAALGLVEAA